MIKINIQIWEKYMSYKNRTQLILEIVKVFWKYRPMIFFLTQLIKI